MHHTNAIAIAIVLLAPLACDSTPDASAANPSPPPTAAKNDAKGSQVEKSPLDWLAEPLQATEVQVDDRKFTVSIPAGLRLEIKPGNGRFAGYADWSSRASGYPGFNAGRIDSPPRDLAAAVAEVELDGRHPVTVKEEFDGGFLVSAIAAGGMSVKAVYTRKGPDDKWYRFRGTQTAKQPFPDPAAVQKAMVAAVKTFAIQ